MTFRSEDLVVGLVALALLPIVGLRIWRGLRDGRLPVYRTSLGRDENRSKFGVLLGLHALSFVLIAVIAADLLFNLGLRSKL